MTIIIISLGRTDISAAMSQRNRMCIVVFVLLWHGSGGRVWGGGLPPPQIIVINLFCPHPTPHFYSRSR